MSNPQDTIEIHEPPVEQFSKKKSCLRRSCVSSCGCVVFFIVGILLILNIFGRPDAKKVKEIPKNIPSGIPIYDKQNITSIAFTKGVQKSQFLETVAAIPKYVIVPLFTEIKQSAFYENRSSTLPLDRYQSYVDNPIGDERNTLFITWTNLPADQEFIYDFYAQQLTNADYIVQNDESHEVLLFQKDGVNGRLDIQDYPNTLGTDTATLLIKYQSSND